MESLIMLDFCFRFEKDVFRGALVIAAHLHLICERIIIALCFAKFILRFFNLSADCDYIALKLFDLVCSCKYTGCLVYTTAGISSACIYYLS